MAKREPSYTIGGNVNWRSLCGKHMRGTVYFSLPRDALSQGRNYIFEIECFQSVPVRTVSLLIMELSGWKHICLVPIAIYRKPEVLVNAP